MLQIVLFRWNNMRKYLSNDRRRHFKGVSKFYSRWAGGEYSPLAHGERLLNPYWVVSWLLKDANKTWIELFWDGEHFWVCSGGMRFSMSRDFSLFFISQHFQRFPNAFELTWPDPSLTPVLTSPLTNLPLLLTPLLASKFQKHVGFLVSSSCFCRFSKKQIQISTWTW